MKIIKQLGATAILALASALLSTQALATVVVQGTIDSIPGTPSNNGGDASEVDYWYFSADSTGVVTIDTLSWLWDKDSDGVAHFMDPYIHLFGDDGSLDTSDLITSNDDSGSTFGDGSVSALDSYLSINLVAGDYILAITDFFSSTSDAVSGINLSGYYPAASDDGSNVYRENNGTCATQGLDCSYADYQITFGGDVTVQNVSVPAPATFLLLCLGLAGLGASRRKKA